MITAHRLARDVVEVTGPEAAAYLQGQLSQDVEGLATGATSWSFVLQPTGKVDAWARVTRLGDEDFLLDVDGGHGEALSARLTRFLLRTKAAVEMRAWTCLAVRGPEAGGPQAGPPGPTGDRQPGDLDRLGELHLPAGWPGTEGYDILGPSPRLPAGVTESDATGYEARRIAAGVPAMGTELTERTIPAEAGQWVIDASVDFTKGCFTGQELVARIDSRGGNVPRHLRGLVVGGADVPPPGAEVTVDGKVVGTVTSSAPAPPGSAGGPVALAYVNRTVDPPAAATVTWDGGTATAEVRALPLDQL